MRLGHEKRRTRRPDTANRRVTTTKLARRETQACVQLAGTTSRDDEPRRDTTRRIARRDVRGLRHGGGARPSGDRLRGAAPLAGGVARRWRPDSSSTSLTWRRACTGARADPPAHAELRFEHVRPELDAEATARRPLAAQAAHHRLMSLPTAIRSSPPRLGASRASAGRRIGQTGAGGDGKALSDHVQKAHQRGAVQLRDGRAPALPLPGVAAAVGRGTSARLPSRRLAPASRVRPLRPTERLPCPRRSPERRSAAIVGSGRRPPDRHAKSTP